MIAGSEVAALDTAGGNSQSAAPQYFPNFKPYLQQKEIQSCAPCHSYREQVKSGSRPGDVYEDYYALGFLRDDLYHHDGQIKEEVYVTGSFMQSKMYHNGCALLRLPQSPQFAIDKAPAKSLFTVPCA